jgi:hypothetical protein
MGMMIIPEDLIEEIESDSEDSEFPATNMLENHSHEVWAAADSAISATINVKTIGAAANGLMLYYLIGDSVTVTIYNQTNLAGSIIAGPTVTDLLASDSYYTNDVQIPGVLTKYTSPGVPHSAKVEISRTGDEPEIGRAFAGKCWEISKNPKWGLGRDNEDHSIVYDLDNGYEYIFQRNVRRAFDGSLELTGHPPTEYFTFLHMMRLIGPNPVAVLMASGALPIYRYLMYGRFTGISATEGAYNLSTINFTLKEFL